MTSEDNRPARADGSSTASDSPSPIKWRKYLPAAIFFAIGIIGLGIADIYRNWFDDEVRIARSDSVDHIYAGSLYGLYYGYGYSLAGNRLFQLDSTLRTVKGEASAAFGEQYLETDKLVLRNTDYGSISAQIAELRNSSEPYSHEVRAGEGEPLAFEMIEGFAAGINAKLRESELAGDTGIAEEFRRRGLKPHSPWTVEDVVLLYVGTMAYRYADFNNELDNLAFLRRLERQHGKDKAWDLFNAAMPLNVKGSPTTIPAKTKAGLDTIQPLNAEGIPAISPAQADDTGILYAPPPRPAYLDRLLSAAAPLSPLFDEQGRALADWSAPDTRLEAERAGQQHRLGRESASNLWMLSAPKLSDADAVLVNGPQFGFVNPSYVYGIALHGEDFRLYGNSLYGYPNLLFGHNGRIGWGSTAGFGDQVDIFQLDIHPDKPDSYYYNGQWRTIERREHKIRVKDAETVHFSSDWTVIGPVMARADTESGSSIYVRRRAWQDQSVRSLIQWLKLPFAANHRQFAAILSEFALSINFYYIDTDGLIGYIHGGAYPSRAPGHDNRLPVALGDSPGLDWRGMRSFADNPQHFDASADYLANWNNRPSATWQNSDLWWVKWSLTDRVGILHRDIEPRAQVTVDEAWGLIERSSYTDINYIHLREALDAALAARGDAIAGQLRQIIGEWDQRWIDQDEDGYYDSPACLWMQAWLTALLSDVFADDIPEADLARFTATGYPVKSIGPAISDSLGAGIVARVLAHGADNVGFDFLNGSDAASIFAASASRTIDDLVAKHGPDPRQWRIANPGLQFNAVNFRGVPTGEHSLSFRAAPMNRGSENNMFVVKDGKIRGYDVIAPDEGSVNADGSPVIKPGGQTEAFFSFGKFSLNEDKDADFFEDATVVKIPRRAE